MAKIVNMATYPGRKKQSVEAIASIAGQVDVVNVVLNEYAFVPPELKSLSNTNFLFPPEDLKDTGKFFPSCAPEDDVFLCDDDILYPQDYVATMIEFRKRHEEREPILGLHGVLYSDYYEGLHGAGRLVDVFNRALTRPRLVNQLGTGTVHCKGYQLPSFDFMQSSQRFVDVRFAIHAHREGYPQICVPREDMWLKQIEIEESIFSQFTKTLPLNVILEIQEISGLARLDPAVVGLLEAGYGTE